MVLIMKRWLLAVVCLLPLAAALGIGFAQPRLDSLTIPFVKAKAATAPATFMAGAATVDITPPPGCPSWRRVWAVRTKW